MSRIVVSGYVVRFPLAGNAWAHLQYVLGLAALGHEVWYVESAEDEASCYVPQRDEMTSDFEYGAGFLTCLLSAAGLERHWAVLDLEGAWQGPCAREMEDIIAGADLFLDVGGSSYIPAMRHARRCAYVDMDPGFTQMGGFAHHRLAEYDALFTYGVNVGGARCSVPTLGLRWHPLLPPTVLDLWRGAPAAVPDACWTTVGNWSAYGPTEYQGEMYGQKDIEFLRLLDLPQRTNCCLELALGGDDLPVERLRHHGWRLQDPISVSASPRRYRDYIWGSRGEFSAAKQGYVKTACGWFSDRTASYLASGRPAVVQRTGSGGLTESGRGLLTYRTLDEAAAALDSVEREYDAHALAALHLAEEHLDANRVLTGLLEIVDV